MVSIFIIAALLHISDFFLLFKGILYLFCLPSGFIFLTVFSVCNLTNQKWGTREESEQSGKTLLRRFLESLKTLRKYCCCCCKELDLEEIGDKKEDEDKGKGDKDAEEEKIFDIQIKIEDGRNITPAESLSPNLEGEILEDDRNAFHIAELPPADKKFWEELSQKIDIRKAPDEKGATDLKNKLKKLRSSWLLIFLTVNTLWTAVIAVLDLHPALMVRGSNALGSIFLLVYGIMFTIQFFACIWNRFETLIHYLSRRNSQESFWDRCRNKSDRNPK